MERADFTPLVFSLTGGMGLQAQAVIRRLGGLLAEREKVSKSDIMGWLRARLSFTVLRAVITCLRGCRSLNYRLASAETKWRKKDSHTLPPG